MTCSAGARGSSASKNVRIILSTCTVARTECQELVSEMRESKDDTWKTTSKKQKAKTKGGINIMNIVLNVSLTCNLRGVLSSRTLVGTPAATTLGLGLGFHLRGFRLARRGGSRRATGDMRHGCRVGVTTTNRKGSERKIGGDVGGACTRHR